MLDHDLHDLPDIVSRIGSFPFARPLPLSAIILFRRSRGFKSIEEAMVLHFQRTASADDCACLSKRLSSRNNLLRGIIFCHRALGVAADDII